MEHTKNCIHTARIVAALLFLTAYLSAQEEVTPSAQLQIAADRVEYGVGSAMARGEGAVEIVYGDLRLTCDKATRNGFQKSRRHAVSPAGDVCRYF